MGSRATSRFRSKTSRALAGESFVRTSSCGKAPRRNSSRCMRRSRSFTMGNAPTASDRSTAPPARATGGEGDGAEGFCVVRERLGDMASDSFHARHRSPADPVPASLRGADGSGLQARHRQKEMSTARENQARPRRTRRLTKRAIDVTRVPRDLRRQAMS